MREAYKKDSFYYWENCIKNTNNILIKQSNKLINKESKIAYVGILDYEKGIVRSGWSSHDNIYDLLGFVQYVFLPASFYTWIDRESQGFFIPLSPFDILKTEVLKDSNECVDAYKDALKLERVHYYLDSMKICDEDTTLIKLKEFSLEFNRLWDSDNRKLYIQIFDAPNEIKDYLFDNTTDFDEIVEEELDMSKDKFCFICDNLYQEPLLNRNFINMLNNKIPFWF